MRMYHHSSDYPGFAPLLPRPWVCLATLALRRGLTISMGTSNLILSWKAFAGTDQLSAVARGVKVPKVQGALWWAWTDDGSPGPPRQSWRAWGSGSLCRQRINPEDCGRQGPQDFA